MKKQFPMLLVLLILTTFMMQAQNKIEINSQQAYELIQKNSEIIILDIRTPDEFKIGHLKMAHNIDVLQSDAVLKLSKLDKTKTYLVYCRTHHRSDNVVDFMMKSGFKTIYQMMDGFTGWMANKLPEEY